MNFCTTLIGLLTGAVSELYAKYFNSKYPVYEVGYRSPELDLSCYENIRHLQLSHNTARLI